MSYHTRDALSMRHSVDLTYILYLKYNRQESSPAKLPSQLLWNHPALPEPPSAALNACIIIWHAEGKSAALNLISKPFGGDEQDD
jgi:hypothetical protein